MQIAPPPTITPAGTSRRLGTSADVALLVRAASNGGWSTTVDRAEGRAIRNWAMRHVQRHAIPAHSLLQIDGDRATVSVIRTGPPLLVRLLGCQCQHDAPHSTAMLGCPMPGCLCIAPISESENLRPRSAHVRDALRHYRGRRAAAMGQHGGHRPASSLPSLPDPAGRESSAPAPAGSSVGGLA